MACTIQISALGEKTGVLNKQGNPSKLFNQIVSNPHINFDKALEIYSTVYELEEEPILVYQNNQGQTFSTFAAALKTTEEGDVIGGVETSEGFKELLRIDSNISTKSFPGLLNNLVKSNLLTGESIIDVDGKKIYKAVGESEYKRMITSDMAITTARGAVGYAAKRISSGDLYFDENLIGKRPILNQNDETEYISQEDLDNKSYQQLRRTTSDPVGIMAERAQKEANRVYGESSPLEELQITPENVLQEKLIKLLSDLGVKTVSFENYFQRNKIEPSAQALADIANKIVAFKNGEIEQSDLTEEVAHFIVEATDPAQLENLLRNVHRTSEWLQFQESYREIYGNKYSGQELEAVIRKEVLGKVLANSLQDNFAQNKESQTHNSIIARLRDIFNQFFTNVQALFKPAYQQQLDSYTKGVYNNLMADSLYSELDTRQLDGKKYVYYSIAQAGIPENYKQLERAIEQLSNQQYALAKKYSAPASQNMLREAKDSLLKAIETTENEIEEASRLKALLNVATVATAQLNYLSRVIDKNSNSGYHFAQEESSVYQNFITKLEPLLSQLNNQFNPKNRSEKQIKEKFEAALKKSVELKGKIPANNKIAIENIVNRVVAKNNLTGEDEQKFRDALADVLTAAQKDTGWFHAHLGQLVHSQNIMLNLAGDVIAKTVTDERRYFLPRIKNFLNQLDAAGYDPRQLKKLIDKDGYIINETDQSKLEAEELNEKVKAYNAVVQGTISAEDFKDSLIDSLSVKDRNNYNSALNELKKERLESFFTQEHLDKLNNTFVEINGRKIYRNTLPKVALEYEQYYRGQLTQIRANNDGINTENDRYEIQELNKQRIKDSNPRNLDGSIKNGLKEVYNEDLGQYIIEREDSTITSDEDLIEAEKVYGLQMINLLNKKFYEGTVRQEGIPQLFLDKLAGLDTEQEKWNFVQLNAYVGFKPEYWENFGDSKSLTERLNEAKDGENNTDIDEIIEDIRTQQSIISNILKANRVFNQPSETNVTEMSDIEKSSVKDAAIQLESLYQKANSFLEESEQVEPFSETRLNEAFRKDLEDEGIRTDDGILNHIQKHVTPKNKTAIDKAIKIAAKIKNGEETAIDKSLQRVFNNEMSPEEAQRALMRFAESRVLPYYKRTEPIGYTAERQTLEEGIANNTPGVVEEFIKNTQFAEISPSYSFYGQSESINPKWLANREAKRPQYTEEFSKKIRNNQFFERYGINEQGEATKNLQEWQARQALLELQDWSIENYGLTGKHNRYLLPQQRKSGARRVESFIKGFNFSNVREGLNDLVNFREDEAEAGQDFEGNQVTNNSQILTIPQYGIRKIENQGDVTDELLHSYSWFAQQSALHRARKENIQDMLVIQDAILNSDIIGKNVTASNTYKMFKSFLNNSFYGVSESFNMEISLLGKKFNLGKMAKVFNNWVRFINLTGIVVPLTSLLQSSVQKSIEVRVGETINPIANKLARKEFSKHASAAAGEIMKLNSGSKINVLMESFGLSSIVEDRLDNSNYNRGIRLALGSARGLHSLGNFPVLPQIMLGILNDYRFYNGGIVSYNQYLRQNPQGNKKQLTEDWQKLELLYPFIKVENGVQIFDKEAIGQRINLSGQQLDQRLNTLHEALSNRVGAAVQDVDSQIRPEERSIAQRDARAAFALMHMSWFTLGWTKHTANYHYDSARDIFFEGSWRTTFNFVQDMIMKKKNIKEAWKEAMSNPMKRRNLTRTILELGVANSLAFIAILLAKYADDDEDDPNWLLGFSDYMVTRLTNEQISSSIALPRQFSQSLQNPVIAFDRFADLANVFDLASGDIVKTGSYAGETERYRWAAKNLPVIKDYHRLQDPAKAADTYQFFNKDVLDYSFISWLMENEENEE